MWQFHSTATQRFYLLSGVSSFNEFIDPYNVSCMGPSHAELVVSADNTIYAITTYWAISHGALSEKTACEPEGACVLRCAVKAVQ